MSSMPSSWRTSSAVMALQSCGSASAIVCESGNMNSKSLMDLKFYHATPGASSRRSEHPRRLGHARLETVDDRAVLEHAEMRGLEAREPCEPRFIAHQH